MPTSADRFGTFAALHVRGKPVTLFNCWDAGSAAAIARAGASALATGSWSVAEAHGHHDGEDLPFALVLANAARIVGAVDLPVSIDLEGGYGAAPDAVAAAAKAIAGAGAVGCNFEDRVVNGDGLYPVAEQSARIAAMRKAVGDAFFINARTDIFLQAASSTHDDAMLDHAIARATAYAAAGASGFFAPGLASEALIRRLCEASVLPVNIMMAPGVPDHAQLADLGAARISHGPGPYRLAMAAVEAAAREVYGRSR
jgi:2-methylisocitrate lyase-like PEP mutase family enzyme